MNSSKRLEGEELNKYINAGKIIKSEVHLYGLVALTFITDEQEIPADAVHPLRDIGQHLALCQMTHYVRTLGKTIVSTLEDHFCMPAASVFGLTDKFPVGIDARHFKNQEAQESIVGIVKERDTYLHNTKALVISPVEDLRVKPDMILAYGYPGQISVLCKCFTWRGIPVTGKFLGSVGCSSIVWSFINQQPVMNIMAGGERGFSHTGDSEVSIVFPGNQLLDTAEAVIGTQKANVNHYPALTRHLYKEPVLLNNYRISYREIN